MKPTEKGDVLENPVTRERAITLEGTGDNDEQRLVSEVHIPPGGRVVAEHLHPDTRERFEVLEGSLNLSLDGRTRNVTPGEPVEIPPRVWHDFWNDSESKAVVKVEVVPGDRFTEMIRTLWGLALDGKTNAKGLPSMLQLVAIAREFDDVIVLRRPPPIVQSVLFGALGPLARLRGYRGTYPRYAEMKSMGTPEEARSSAPLTPRFAAGQGPPR